MLKIVFILISVSFSLSLVANDLYNFLSAQSLAIKKDTNKSIKDKPSSVCKTIPLMLIHLPPMIEKDLNRCKNLLYKPDISLAEKKLQELLKMSIKVHKVSIVKGFSMLYKIETSRGDFYCNKQVDRCITSTMKIVNSVLLQEVR